MLSRRTGGASRVWRACLALIVALGLTLGLAMAAPASAAGSKRQGDLQQMSQQVRQLIKVVEGSAMPCDTRNEVVRRLRLLNDAIESGRRSAAGMLLTSWMDNARTSVATGVITPQLGASLNNGMASVLAQIGTGWPEKPKAARQWKPLPVCSPQSEPVEFTSDDLLILINGALKMVPKVGSLLAGIVTVLWPSNGNDVSALIDQAIEDSLKQQLGDDLDGLHDLTGLFLTRVTNWQTDCPDWEHPERWGGDYTSPCYTGAKATSEQWWTTYSFFTTSRPHFQSQSPTDYRVTLLPLFAQYENLLIGVLREGMLLEPYWKVKGVGVDPSDAEEAGKQMARELDPNRPDDIGISYVDAVYQLGLDQQPQPANQDKWVERNDYVRSMTIDVLDYRDTWQYLDPQTYPQGLPGGVKLTRMIYSDPIGHVQQWDAFTPPANVPGPMTELTVWLQRFSFTLSTGTNQAVEAVQSTSPPSNGAARPGPVTGDAGLDLGGATSGRTTSYFDLRRQGPIVTVTGRQDRYNPLYFSIANALGLTFANGQTTWVGSRGTTVGTFHYPGYVLATARAVGQYDIGGGHTADAVILGFRRPDSFLTSSSVVSIASGACLSAAGGALTTAACDAGANQTWGFYQGTQALINGDGSCLTINGTSLSTTPCAESTAQRWELVPSAAGGGQIRAVGSGLVVQAGTGGTVVAAASNGGANQRWTPPSPQVGPIHGIGQGRCLTIAGRTNGAAAIMWDCDQPGNASDLQQWAFDASAGTLRILGGTKCLQASGTTAVISDCTGARNQQWLVDPATNLITSVDSQRVLDVSGGSTANGTAAILSPYSGSYSQFWSRPSDQGEALYAVGAGKCLSIVAATSGTQTTIESCASNVGQQWVYHPLTGRFTAFDSRGTAMCLAPDTTGAKAVVVPCGGSGQQWMLSRGSDNVTSLVQHAASGKCLTLPGTGTVTAAGTKVEVQACRSDATQINQQWQWGGAS